MNRQQRREQKKKAGNGNSSGVAHQVETAFAKALQYHKAGQLAEAAAIYRQIISNYPAHTKSMGNLGAIMLDTGHANQATTLFRQALAIEPDNPNMWYNLGNALRAIEQNADSLTSYKKAIHHKPGHTDALAAIGNIHKDTGSLEKAEEFYKKVLSIQPNHMMAYLNLSRILGHQARHNESIKLAEEFASQNPDNKLLQLKPLSIQPMIAADNDEIKTHRRNLSDKLNRAANIDLDAYIDSITPLGCYPSFYLNYHGLDNRKIKESYASLFHAEQPDTPNKPTNNSQNIGILVTDYHEGIFLKIMKGILNNWEEDRIIFTLICSSRGKDILSGSITNPNILFLEVPTHSLRQTKNAVVTANFDVMFYWEIGSDSLNYFLPFFRLAPIQCTSWGSADTTGMQCIDYFISSHLQEPKNAQNNYTERLVLFDNVPSYFEKPSDNIGIRTREELGLQEDRHLYIVPQNPFKIHPDFDIILRNILEADPEGIIVLIHDKNDSPGNILMKRLGKVVADNIGRVVMLPRQDMEGYFSLLRVADVMLDTLYFGGGTTSMEALAFGTPIVTLPGEYLRGRSTLALYKMMGITDLVANTEDEYVQYAVKLATEPTYRKQIQQNILQKNDCLYSNKSVISDFEKFFLSLR